MAGNTTDGSVELSGAYDVIVVGAGIAGLYAIYRFREMGLSVRAFERATGIGGTWHWNRYPGLRCDAESLDYSFSFSDALQQEWEWSERFPAQPEILRYLDHVADRFSLRDHIMFETPVQEAAFADGEGRWVVRTDSGAAYTAQWLVMATGALSEPQPPPYPGLERYRGDWYQTSRWPREGVALDGRRVGLIGTGSTGIQFTIAVAPVAEQLTVFQRTANFSVPARNRPLDPALVAETKANYARFRDGARYSGGGTIVDRRYDEPGYGVQPTFNDVSVLAVSEEERLAELERRWAYGGAPEMLSCFNDITLSQEANGLVADFFRDKIRQTVKDPVTAELLCPDDHPLGTKRICVDTGYYETFNRDNVALVDVRANPIQEVTERGLGLRDGTEHELDVIVFALGFDALTGALLNVDIVGREDARLRERWHAGPHSYLGLMVSGFPNMFTITGPNSPSVRSNMVTSIEQHIDYVCGLIREAGRRGAEVIDAEHEAQEAWVSHCNELVAGTLYPLANSWTNGANIPGKPRMYLAYLGGVGPYRRRCEEIAADGYPGFAFA